ncbi:MAG TPA: hypothetical protein DF296_00075 [Candidatus Margulisbacteria bacterium]|nr:MAG: hypothetical protein A2X43_11665 [Candidatus Margulisbacteria bacterium GWD2_39_127]HAR63783.1 hypothetical protein [Candidatus Margulisiibacteriota bacterium]HCT83578.1 hypothetical protein [Candidatus Margulisiibacteriota bacterium]
MIKNKILLLKDLLTNLVREINRPDEATIFIKIDNLLQEIQQYREQAKQDKELIIKNFFRDNILPIAHQSAFCKYTFDKPRGYAGDFEAMEYIWNGKINPDMHRYLGTTEVGRVINAFTLDSANCRANESRVYRFKDIISKSAYKKVASIGSGSAIEIREFLKEHPTNEKSFFLYEQDKDAIRRVKQKVTNFNPDIHYFRGNIIKTILKDQNKYDLIYSSGLFDYFNIDSSTRLVAALWNKLEDGGSLIITNAHPNNPTKLWMEYVGDWYLIYKTNSEMYSLADNLDRINSIDLSLDHMNVYQYLHITKE